MCMISTETALLLEEDPLSILLLKGLIEQLLYSILHLISLTLRLKLCSSFLIGSIYGTISIVLKSWTSTDTFALTL